MQALVDTTDSLIKARDQAMNIPFGDRPVPPIFQAAPWLFQAADMPEYGGIAAALPPAAATPGA